MGAGSSKEKSPNSVKGPVVVAKSDNNSKPLKPQNIENHKKNDFANTGNKQQSKPTVDDTPKPKNEAQVWDNRRTQQKMVKQIESDSESEGEDIAEIIAATKREQNKRVHEQNYYNANKDSSLPETYAQRLKREQHQQQQMLVRQKTIYRNPDEWKVDEIVHEVEKDSTDFDVRKFKEANAASNIQNRTIYSSNNNDMTLGPEPDLYQPRSLAKKDSLPRYDMSEEALLAEIEKEYDF